MRDILLHWHLKKTICVLSRGPVLSSSVLWSAAILRLDHAMQGSHMDSPVDSTSGITSYYAASLGFAIAIKMDIWYPSTGHATGHTTGHTLSSCRSVDARNWYRMIVPRLEAQPSPPHSSSMIIAGIMDQCMPKAVESAR
jgi:hypothetical protein